MIRILLVIAMAMLLSFVLIGCEGEEGPAGPQGEKGDTGQKADPYTYVGNDGEECGHCHGSKVDGWMGTKHPNAYADLDAEDQDNPYCVQCHTTGFDATVAYGDTTITNPGPDIHGFDDYFGVEGDEAAMRRDALAGVQCEACHGPLGPLDGVAAHRAEVNVGTYVDVNGEFVSTCNPCHSRQLEEWSMSGHAMAAGGVLEDFQAEHYASSGSCVGCHTSEGFLAANDPSFANFDFDEYTFVGCVACHDPHNAQNPGQLRTVDAVYVEYHLGYDPEEGGDDGVFSGYGGGQTCAQCHHARRDTDNVTDQIANGYGHFGPHGSPQTDMFVGWGCYEIDGYDYERSNSHQEAIDDACVSCHMVRFEELHGDEANHVYHQFAPQGAACNPCHSLDPGDFDRGGVQTNTEAKMNELAGVLGYADWASFADHDNGGWDSLVDGVTPDERMAAYALVFVINDGSRGIHNPSYSMDLLQNAIDHLDE
ncbi:cytochrome c552 [bacterium BMS3Bbin04]|nr:cytochrome c552 [bacterium BMS3Bbin04]